METGEDHGLRETWSGSLSMWAWFQRATTASPIAMHTAVRTPVRPGVQYHNTTIGALLGSATRIEHMFNDSGGGSDSVIGPPSIVTIIKSMKQMDEFPSQGGL